MSGIFCQKGLIDWRPDFLKIDDELRTWAGSGTEPDGFYYDYSHLAKIMNTIIYHPRQKQFVQIKEGWANIIQELPIMFAHLKVFHKFPCYQCYDSPPPQATSVIGLE